MTGTRHVGSLVTQDEFQEVCHRLAQTRRIVWVLIVLVILSGMTGFLSARYYASGLRRNDCDVYEFLRAAQVARQQAADRETGLAHRNDEATAASYGQIAHRIARRAACAH